MPELRSVAPFIRGLPSVREHAAHERWDRERLETYQRERLAVMIAHARSASPFYRELYAGHGVDERTPLHDLPPVDKPDLMARFDEWVTDPRVTLAAARLNLDAGAEHKLPGGFTVLASGGSSRVPGVFAYGPEWSSTLWAIAMRISRWTGMTPRLPRRRVAVVFAPGQRHMAARSARMIDVGIHRILRLSATTRRAELVDALNAFQPDTLSGYASIIALLASEQLDGPLRIAPTSVTTNSEPRPPGAAERIREAWGTEPHDLYATTETGPVALDCTRHGGLHVFEDLTIIEVVDANDQAVPDGQAGDHVLLTNLFNRVQPMIRYRASDLTAYEPSPCACGLPFRRLRTVEGRADDILELPTATGSHILMHPTAFAPLFTTTGVAELQIVQRNQQLLINVVPRRGADTRVLTATLERETNDLLARNGANGTPIKVTAIPNLQRDHSAGKVKLVRREPD